MILTLRTDNPQAEIGLYDGTKQIAEIKWQAHRRLAETIHQRISEILANHQVAPGDITGIVVYRGPGSFTGLRIGISVANTLAYGLGIPIVGTIKEKWIQDGLSKVIATPLGRFVVPEYGSDPHITVQKK